MNNIIYPSIHPVVAVSKLVCAKNWPKPGGGGPAFVEPWDTIRILHASNAFSNIELYKHLRCHAITSSFYLVAKYTQLGHDARISLSYWENLWRYLILEEFRNISSP